MLSPDARTVATDILRPPAGFALDHALITTYSLDLDVILALPLAVMAQSDKSVEELLADPMLTLEALREAGRRLDIFVDESSIAVPHTNRALYAMLEDCVHPMRAVNGGAFHPKIWLVRFRGEDDSLLLRVAVVSRNLTYDRSWDVALVSEAVPGRGKAIEPSADLGGLIRALPGMAVHGLDDATEQQIAELARQFEATRFPGPDGVTRPIYFEALGIHEGIAEPWYPWEIGDELLAIAPFVNRTGLKQLVERSTGPRTLISRRQALDDLPEAALEGWDEVLVLADAAIDETEDGIDGGSDLHAKLIAVERKNRITWYLGSANVTAAAYTGRNVEVLASIVGPRKTGGKSAGFAVADFREAGFANLCERYRRGERQPEDPAVAAAKDRLEKARDALVRGNFTIACEPAGEQWRWTVTGEAELPAGVSIRVWPVSLREEQFQSFEPSLTWSLPMSRLTAFAAFRLRVEAEVDDVTFVLKLPATGMPEGRVAQVLRGLIDSPEKFIRFLRALLGGLDGMIEWAGNGDGAGWQGDWGAGLDGETLLEDLVRAAARDPERLEPVRRLIGDLRSTPEGREIVPDDLFEIWQVIDEAVADQSTK